MAEFQQVFRRGYREEFQVCRRCLEVGALNIRFNRGIRRIRRRSHDLEIPRNERQKKVDNASLGIPVLHGKIWPLSKSPLPLVLPPRIDLLV
jgi:hypothetical protein